MVGITEKWILEIHWLRERERLMEQLALHISCCAGNIAIHMYSAFGGIISGPG